MRKAVLDILKLSSSSAVQTLTEAGAVSSTPFLARAYANAPKARPSEASRLIQVYIVYVCCCTTRRKKNENVRVYMGKECAHRKTLFALARLEG